MKFQELIAKIEEQCKTLVWWKPEQIARGEDVVNDPGKGERVWAVPRSTGQFLHDMISRHRPAVVLELGTSIGYSTIWMADALSQTTDPSTGLGQVHTIEHSQNKIPVAQENFNTSDYANLITLHAGEILEVLQKFPDDLKFDFVFMDADRGHYHEYFPEIEKHLASNAVIVADNAITHAKRMQPFLDMLNEKGWHTEILDMDNGILVAQNSKF